MMETMLTLMELEEEGQGFSDFSGHLLFQIWWRRGS
jgi:hypothetical protein